MSGKACQSRRSTTGRRSCEAQHPVQRRPARHVKADHFVRTLRRRAARVNQNQQARDDRHVRLNFDSVLLRTQQMTAAQQLFEHVEK